MQPKGKAAASAKVKASKESETPKPSKKAKVDSGVAAKKGLKGKKSDKIEGEAFDFNEFF